MFSNPTNISSNDIVKTSIENALKFVKRTCVIGAGNIFEDVEKSGFWSVDMWTRARCYGYKSEILNNKKKWIYDSFNGAVKYSYTVLTPKGNPLQDKQFDLNLEQIELLSKACFAITNRSGNCEFQCSLAAKYLWENPRGINSIHLVSMKNYDHCFLIINLHPFAKLNNSETWGKDAWILDPWYLGSGIIYPTKDYLIMITQVLDFAKQQEIELQKMDVKYLAQKNQNNDFEVTTLCSIHMYKNKYPTYQQHPFHPLENYISIDVYKDYEFVFDKHVLFKPCIKQITVNEENCNKINEIMMVLIRELKPFSEYSPLAKELEESYAITNIHLKIRALSRSIKKLITALNNYFENSNHLDFTDVVKLSDQKDFKNILFISKHVLQIIRNDLSEQIELDPGMRLLKKNYKKAMLLDMSKDKVRNHNMYKRC